jgi:hypothetical protein
MLVILCVLDTLFYFIELYRIDDQNELIVLNTEFAYLVSKVTKGSIDCEME